MSSAIQTSPSAPPAGGGPSPPVPAPRPRARSALREALRPVASLRLTVALFALSMVLVFFGTLAQMDAGVWSVVNGYFRSFFVWIPFQLLVQFGQVFFGLPRDMQVPGAFPFPGGWLLGAALLVSLTAAHLARFRVSWKRSGILVLHGGLVLLLVNELLTGLFAVEARMTLENGE